ncbi:hypothetical protein CAPTEDRAFT_198458 [Capitella teleta]|uniref:Uncharacterized protein n=1 Tax=Capitella teleta TaxID=283909 RepID=R7UVW3_CAPTE|nr:hypothetical protein CAPTEDRAFT_198458 [Capitella teleta]|eukprot:ELU07521.1 hypothetical protein CAPTEDRAFT_198458 [Capitella teleta]
MICSFLLFASLIVGRNAGIIKFTTTPGKVYGLEGGRAVMVWEYETEGRDLGFIQWDHSKNGSLIRILRVTADGTVTPGNEFSHASFTPPATITLDPLEATDAGNVICSIFLLDATLMGDTAIVTIVELDGKY